MSMSVGAVVTVEESGVYTCLFIYMCVLGVFVGVFNFIGGFP